ncbi:hypothetical protein [Couchioplanes azureus]|uniref:hypothetical protein n=1 Tax=Couchioplanes caeruleus TaxID=56438 RepID=UPI00166F809E|nr:hypothetical protein [Couchioplanes caeruleus]GGQ85463.1 hypothetical protein GCM10010166_64760 [Couchioplanes caeruleus subsp. azureus]
MRRRVLTIGGSAAIVVAVAGIAVWIDARDDERAGLPPDPTLAADVTQRLVRSLEQDPRFRTEISQEPGRRPVCAAKLIGIAPAAATDMARVEKVYAWVVCKWIPTGTSTSGPTADGLSGLTSPIAVQFRPDFRYTLPADGEGHEESVKDIFPTNLHQVATDGVPGSGSLETIVNQRISRLIPLPSPSQSG